MASAAANADDQGAGVPGPGAGNKTDALRLFDRAVHDNFFWAYLDPGPWVFLHTFCIFTIYCAAAAAAAHSTVVSLVWVLGNAS